MRKLVVVFLNAVSISKLLNTQRVVMAECVVLPLVLYYSRLFTVGLTTTWGLILAACVSRAGEIILVFVLYLLFLM